MMPPSSPPGPDDLDVSPEELAQAQALARALDGHGEHPDAAFAEALRAAHHPAALAPARHEELLVEALARAEAQRPARVISLSARRWAAMATFAAAACFLLILGRTLRRPVPVALAASRSTQELFSEQFPRQGGNSARVDRIAGARSRELRSNRFAQWGVP